MVNTLLKALCLNVITPFAVISDDDLEDFREIYGNEQMVGIATGYTSPLADSPSVVTVVTADEIRKMGAITIEDVLETVPGFHVSSANGFVPAYVIRGIFSPLSSHVLVMQDGIPVNDPVNSGKLFTYTHLTKNISRIEIIRGPGSALYGSDAFAGVINIITKTGREIDGGDLGGFAGSFDTYGGWALLGKQWEDFDVSFSAQGRTTNGQGEIVTADAQTRIDTLLNTRASLAPGPINVARDDIDLGLSLRYKNNARFHARYQDSTTANGVGTTLALDPSGQIRYQSWTTGLGLQKLRGNVEYHFDFNYFYYQAHTLNNHFPTGAFGGLFHTPVTSEVDFVSHSVDVAFKTIVDGFDGHRLFFGIGYQYALANDIVESRNFRLTPFNLLLPTGGLQSTDTLGVEPFANTTDRHIGYGFVQDEWRFANDWLLTTGARIDYYSDFGVTVNPRASVVWQVDPSLTSKLIYGRAFRAPSFIELNSNRGLQLQGNPDLQPETIDTVELSLQKNWPINLSTGLNLFWYATDDLIVETSEQISSQNAIRTFENSAGAFGYGLEVITRYLFYEDLVIDFNYTYLIVDPKDDRHDNFIIAAPQHDLFAQLNWRFFKDWNFNIRSNWIIGRQRATADPRDPIGDDTLVSLALMRNNLLDGLSLTFKVDNLLDVDARHPSINGLDIPFDYPLAGIAFTGLMEYRF